jgi:sodium/hydrogen exchanger 8
MLQGQAIDSEHLSEYTEEEMEVNFIQSHIKGFAKYDLKYFIPFFTRRFTQQVRELCYTHSLSLFTLKILLLQVFCLGSFLCERF